MELENIQEKCNLMIDLFEDGLVQEGKKTYLAAITIKQ